VSLKESLPTGPLLLLLLSLSACEQEADASADAQTADGGVVVDAQFPDAETDPCVPRVLEDAPVDLQLLGLADELFAWKTEGGGELWHVVPNGWRFTMPLGAVFPGVGRLWVRSGDAFVAVDLEGNEVQRVQVDLEGVRMESLAEGDGGRLVLAGHTGGISEEQAVVLAHDAQRDEAIWRFDDEAIDGSRTLVSVLLVAADGRVYALGTFFPSADPQETFLLSFSPEGDRLTVDVAHEIAGVALVESGGQVFVFGHRQGQPAIAPFGDVAGPVVAPPVPAGFEYVTPHRIWAMPDGWLMVMDLRGGDGVAGQPFTATWVVRTDSAGEVLWDRQYADSAAQDSAFQSAALAGDRLHLLTRAASPDAAGPPDRQVALDLAGGCQVAPRLIFSR
jgi:hypothetical protein